MLNFIYGLACVMVPCIVYQFVAQMKQPLSEHKTSHFLWTSIFLLYIYLVCYLTDVGTLWNFIEHDLTLTLKLINIIPFHTGTPLNYFLNVLLFIPLGFLLPLIWWEMRKPKIAVLSSCGFSLAIELSQLCNNRYSDIDDFLMNVLGAALGYLIWMFTWKLFQRTNEKAVSIEPKEPEMLLTLSFLGYFFLYNWRFVM